MRRSFPPPYSLSHVRDIPESRLEGTSATYTPTEKREELFDTSTRFLLLLQPISSNDVATASKPALKGKKGAKTSPMNFNEEDLKGYCSFRFDTEETLGSSDVEVVYWCV